MVRRSFTLVALMTLSLAVAAAALALRDATPKLKGTVGPGFTIQLKKSGRTVKRLKSGRYTFVIADKSSIHNFELEKVRGGEFERELTHVSFVGTKTARIRLTVGRYKYYCEPHESSMFGFFTVKR